MLYKFKNTSKKYNLRNMLSAAKKFFIILYPYRNKIIIISFLATISAVLGIIAPKILAHVTNELFYGVKDYIDGTGSIDFEQVFYPLCLCLILYIVSTILVIIQGYIEAFVSRKWGYALREELANKVTRLNISEYELLEKGDVMARMSNDINIVQHSVLGFFSNILKNIVLVIGSFVMMFCIDWFLMVLVIISLTILLFLSWIEIKFSQKYFILQQNTYGKITAFIDEFFCGHILVQAYNKEDSTIGEFQTINNTLYKQNIKSQMLSTILTPLKRILNNSVYIIIVVLGAWKILNGTSTLGDIQAFLQYKRSFEQPILSWLGSINSIQQASAAYNRIESFMSKKEEANILTTTHDNVQTDEIIKFKNVSFSYDKRQQVIHDISFGVKKGETIAIVGPTGAGKTTLVKLLLRFYETDKGHIFINGKNIKSISYKELRENFAVVLQSVWLFNGSIKENIKYGNLRASEDQIIRAAYYANCEDFITILPEKYDTMVNERSTNFSYGQQQLLSIARAIATSRDILILDEATSSVDSVTEDNLYKAFDKIIEENTSIVIAHRLSTVKKADKIIVIDNGEIIEEGNHATLISNKSYYYNLYKTGLMNDEKI